MIRYKPIDTYTLGDFRDAITYTKLMARSGATCEERAKAKIATAFCEMMDLLEPQWYVAAHKRLIEQAKSIGVQELPVGNIGFSSVSDIHLTFEQMMLDLSHKPLTRQDPQ